MSILGKLLRRQDLHSLAAPYALDALEPGERRRFEKHPGGLRPLRRGGAGPGRGRGPARLVHGGPRARRPARPGPGRRPQHPAGTGPGPAAHGTAGPGRRPGPRGRPGPGAVPGARAPAAAARLGHPAPARPRPDAAGAVPLFAPLATATAAAALVVASLFAVQAQRTEDRLTAEQARAREIAHVLAAPDARAASTEDARGRSIGVIASASGREAVVTPSGYGTPPGGRVHQLWLMRPRVQPRSLGLLRATRPWSRRGSTPPRRHSP